MEYDVLTIIAVAVSVAIAVAIYYLYEKHDKSAVNKVYGTVKTLFDAFGDRLKEDQPEVYQELKDCLDTMERAMSDDTISIIEAYEIAKAFIPLVKRIEKAVQRYYE